MSLNGPVHVSSLPEIVGKKSQLCALLSMNVSGHYDANFRIMLDFAAERPESSGGDLLLTDDFMRECVKKYSVPSRGNDTNYRTFMQKHLNIVDPLKENNNLGRSVSKGIGLALLVQFFYFTQLNGVKFSLITVDPQLVYLFISFC